MARDQGRNGTRERIAHLAARLMAEDGIESYALAKRKAARQAGVPDSGHMPTNDEIDAALRVHLQLYRHDEHQERLRALRLKAVDVMRELARFDPHLTGAVLSGNAGRYADIKLQLYSDDAKAVEMYLINHQIPYKTAQSRLYSGEEPRIFPVFIMCDADAEIDLTVLGTRDLRMPVRTSLTGRAMDRARLQAVEAMLQV